MKLSALYRDDISSCSFELESWCKSVFDEQHLCDSRSPHEVCLVFACNVNSNAKVDRLGDIWVLSSVKDKKHMSEATCSEFVLLFMSARRHATR